jgi:hypothetical protein
MHLDFLLLPLRRLEIGNLVVSLKIKIIMENTGYEYTNIVLAAPTTTTIFSGRGVLRKIIINKPLANGVITIYDNTAASGTKIGTITQPATLLSDLPAPIEYDAVCGIGCTIVTATAAQDITVIWEQL